MYCKNCGAKISIKDRFCPNCGAKKFDSSTEFLEDNTLNAEPDFSPKYKTNKSKELAGILGIFFGCFGLHNFYVGKIGLGIIDILFFWTGIPSIAGFIKGLIYIFESPESFENRFRK